MRRLTPVELALGASLGGCILAVAIPVFLRELHASKLAEPTEGLARLGAAACVAAAADGRFPDSAPLTPATPPRGKKEIDPPGTWDAPTWQRLDFRAAPEGVPHAFSFAFEGAGSSFIAHAHGDLDGDGVQSRFEIRGVIPANDKPTVEPGMYVESELE